MSMITDLLSLGFRWHLFLAHLLPPVGEGQLWVMEFNPVNLVQLMDICVAVQRWQSQRFRCWLGRIQTSRYSLEFALANFQ